MTSNRYSNKSIGWRNVLFSKQLRLVLLTLIFVTVLMWIAFRSSDLFESFKKPKINISRSQFFSSQTRQRKPSAYVLREENNATVSVFLIIDSQQMQDASNLPNLLKQWIPEQLLLRDCNPRTFCRVQVILYGDDVKTSDLNIQQTIVDLLASSNSSSGEVDMIQTVGLGQEDAHIISDVIMDEYIEGADYFLILTTACLENNKAIRRSRQTLIKKLSSFYPRDVGIVRFESYDKANRTAGVFLSKRHIEISGELFPFEITTLPGGLEFLSTLYDKNLTRIISIQTSKYIRQNLTTSYKSASLTVTGEFMAEQKDFLQRYVNAAAESGDCLTCNIHNGNKVIAMSLYGNSSRYTRGALRNAQLLPLIYPGWRLWLYTEADPSSGERGTQPIPTEILKRLVELGAEMRYVDVFKSGLAPMLWRFSVLDEPDVEMFIIRDCDSRLTPRDVAVVTDWLKTDKPFHCIRDHPSHSNFAVSGGLWGGRPSRLKNIFGGGLLKIMQRYGTGYIEDMNFLNKNVWPTVKDQHAFCHDSYSCDRYVSSHPFPVVRKGYEHLGQVYDEHSIGRTGDIDILKKAPINRRCIPS